MIGKRKRIRQQLRKGKKNPDELASCYGKIRHTKLEAKIEVAKKPSFIKAYKCRYGDHYHIGRKQS